MGFESGAISFSMYYLPHGIPSDHVERFAARGLPGVDSLGREPVKGWVTGRHLLDNNITEDTARVAGRLRLSLARAERKIPAALLKAECTMEELAVMAADGKAYLDRRSRSEIKKSISERLLPRMPPTLTGIPIVYDPSTNILYAGATTDKQIDLLVWTFQEATGAEPVPLTPESAALKRKQISISHLQPTSFSPECPDEMADESVGMDFLTWLWFYFEKRGGVMTLEGEQCGIMLEGPLTFFMDGSGAHVTVLRKGEPLLSSEAGTALRVGKKLRMAKVIIARGDETWSATLDAKTFIFRGMKLPKSEAMDPVGRFEDRMLCLERFRHAFLTFYDRFLDERLDARRWQDAQSEIHAWVASRAGIASS